MAILSGSVQLKNALLNVKLLDLDVRDITTDTVTVTASATPTAVGSTTITVTATTADMPAGTALSFAGTSGRTQALLSADAATGATSLNVFPLIKAIPASATATFVEGLLPLYGMQEFSNSDAPEEVDTTNTLSGFGKESALVRSDHTIDISGIQIPADPALYGIIKPLAKSGGLFGREVYAVFTNADGEVIRGAAKIKNYSEPGNQNEVKKYSFQLQFQGSSYEWLTPHTITLP